MSANDRVQDIGLNQVKLKVNDTYKENEKITTNFEPINETDVLKKAYLDTKLTKIDGHISFLQKDYNEFKLHIKKQRVEEMIENAVKTSTQLLYDEVFFDNFVNADEVLKGFLLVQSHKLSGFSASNERRRPDLDEIGVQSAPWNFQFHWMMMTSFHDCIHKFKWKYKATSNMKFQKNLFFLVFQWCEGLFERLAIFKW